MLAKEIKIKNLRKQREFIEKQLSHTTSKEDGDTAYRYVGHVYPEVIEYFENEGFMVTKIESDMLTMMTKGLPVYLFTVGEVKLSDEEMKEAESYYEPEEPGYDSDDSRGFEEFVRALMGGMPM